MSFRSGAFNSHELVAFLTQVDPALIPTLAVRVAESYPELSGTLPFISFLKVEDAPAVIEQLVALLLNQVQNQTAEQLLDEVSRQFPHLVEPHLPTLIAIPRPSGFPVIPSVAVVWSLAPEPLLRDLAVKVGARYRSSRFCSELLSHLAANGRHAELHTVADMLGCHLSHHGGLEAFAYENGQVLPLYSKAAYYVIPPPDYEPYKEFDHWHPTWNLPTLPGEYKFGGRMNLECNSCGEALHRALDLSPAFPDLDLSVSSLELGCCFACVGMMQDGWAFAHHDGSGRQVSHVSPDTTSAPNMPTVGLAETTVAIAIAPRRWQNQQWHNNPNRLGGRPVWIQESQHLNCPVCDRPQRYLAEVHLNLPEDDEYMNPPSSLYCFWCDHCRISSYLQQSE